MQALVDRFFLDGLAAAQVLLDAVEMSHLAQDRSATLRGLLACFVRSCVAINSLEASLWKRPLSFSDLGQTTRSQKRPISLPLGRW